MKCENCPADSALGCKAGVMPYQLRSGDTGCAWNMRIIKKHMNDRKRLTNYDRIVSKTPEELARWIGEVTAGGYGLCAPGHYDCAGKDSCAPCWLDWLKRELEDG